MFSRLSLLCRSLLAATISLVAVGSACAAINVTGNFNSSGGYDIFNFNVASAGNVEFTYTGGYGDPTFSLFNSSGAHLVSNDDSLGLYSHLTQTLAAGNYSLLISYCCSSISYAANNGATYSANDGFNNGSYWFGGSGTLAGMSTYLDSLGWNGNPPYALTIEGNVQDVPEPAGLALMAIALTGFFVSRRKQA